MATQTHTHSHDGDHDSLLSGESYAHVHGGPIVLDIGGDIGALVATVDPSTVGTELHLRSEHRPPIEIHTGVWRRGSGPDKVTAAVFPELVAGTYWVLDDTGRRIRPVDIHGAVLAKIDLRETTPIRSTTGSA